MPLDPIDVGDDLKWGLLVKTWATGEDYVQNGYSYPKPGDLDELKKQIRDAEAKVKIPGYITSLMVVQGPKDVLILKLPPREMVKDSEDKLKTQAYEVPKFYGPRAFNNQPSN